MSTDNEQIKGLDELFEEAIADEEAVAGEVVEVDGGNEDQARHDDQPPAQAERVEGNEHTDTKTDTGSDPDYKQLYEQELQRTKSWDGRLSAKDRELATLRQELEAIKAKSAETKETEDPTTDEAIDAFLKEFPELAAPIQKMIEKATKTRSKELATDIEGRIESKIKPIAQTVQETTVEKHINAIRTAHTDFDEIVQSGSLQTWINEQPGYMQPALQAVYDQGTTKDVIDLIAQYKTATGRVARTESDGVTDKNTHKRPAAAVKSRHSTPMSRKQTIAEDDFEGALAAAFAKD